METISTIKEKKQLQFYEISQNNSGGSHIVDDKVCHRLFIFFLRIKNKTFIFAT
jgi:hypothetical protein